MATEDLHSIPVDTPRAKKLPVSATPPTRAARAVPKARAKRPASPPPITTATAKRPTRRAAQGVAYDTVTLQAKGEGSDARPLDGPTRTSSAATPLLSPVASPSPRRPVRQAARGIAYDPVTLQAKGETPTSSLTSSAVKECGWRKAKQPPATQNRRVPPPPRPTKRAGGEEVGVEVNKEVGPQETICEVEPPPTATFSLPATNTANDGAAGGMTDVERERAERIRQNQARMRAIMGDVVNELVAVAKPKPKPAPIRRPRPERITHPIRRSTRSAAQGVAYDDASLKAKGEGFTDLGVKVSTRVWAVGDGDDVGGVEEEPYRAPSPSDFDTSDVLRYACETGATLGSNVSKKEFTLAQGRGGGYDDIVRCRGYRETSLVLCDPYLQRAYTMSYQDGLLAAAGHQGRLAIWGVAGPHPVWSDNAEEVLPLISAQVARGWIADCQFLSSQPNRDGSRLMLVAANDGNVQLLDVGKQHAGTPQTLLKDTGLHTHGIFSLEEAHHHTATASKDGSVAWASLDTAGPSLRVVRRYEDAHGGGVVKCVRVAPGVGDATSARLASAGNDGCVRVWDVRSNGADAACTVAAHEGYCASFAEWHPEDASLLLTSGQEDEVKIWDLRQPHTPLHIFRGHCGGRTGRISRLYRPIWVNAGKEVLVSGPGSDQLSVYDAVEGRTVSRGEIGYVPTTMMSFKEAVGGAVVCSTTKRLRCYVPDFNDE